MAEPKMESLTLKAAVMQNASTSLKKTSRKSTTQSDLARF